MTQEKLEIVKGLIIYYMGVQMIFSVLVLVLGRAITNQYELGYTENPTNIFQKIINFLMVAIFGLGPYLNKRFMKYSWIKRKLFMLVSIFVLFWVCVIIYYILKAFLDAIFL
ncbi:hypothetical protein [Neobacillus niacini]|uniref:hypothetical protein n=1 Tax=Neobacillus niacini TaxID=86668 RepID=UPI00286680E1|nr:hypothetical protein [Neobacillus niacini]MDR6999332.1 magnesium-transporting ATPase (P-type) [Neobacillus niacini]